MLVNFLIPAAMQGITLKLLISFR